MCGQPFALRGNHLQQSTKGRRGLCNGAQRRIIRLGFRPKRCLNPESATGLRNLVGTARSAPLLQEDDEEGDEEEGDEEVPRNSNQQTCRLTLGLRYRYLRLLVPVLRLSVPVLRLPHNPACRLTVRFP